ncbi:MAG: glutaredoxin domain-containing protein [Planctomycetota bacterium]|jgi:glutaredoxin 3
MALIEIYSSGHCNYCEQAKALLEAKNLEYQIYDIASDETLLEEFRQRLPRSLALPQIFIGGEHIGGYEDLVILEREGKLDQLS